MGFQALLLVPPATDEGRWLSTETTARTAADLVTRFGEVGFIAEADKDEAEEGDVYDEVVIEVAGGSVGVALTSTGGYLSADAEDERHPDFWRAIAQILAIVEKATGAVPSSRDAEHVAEGTLLHG